ncbi:hypothetical protein BPTFM16_02218 [Altererythrobacter insulae]|nr:hypothetical protein BPTFM16_02218 [Altererythrobacter insulae]
MTKGILAAAAIGALLSTTPAIAGDKQKQQAVVMYDDLDLSTEQGRKELDDRVKIAARKNCGVGRHSTGTRSITREQRRCVAAATKQAKSALAPVIDEQRLGG